MEDNKLILISELISDKRRKEKELEFYEAELRKLLVRLNLVRHESRRNASNLMRKEEDVENDSHL